jgi:hypothetical protein
MTDETEPQAPNRKPSTAPSWVMLGFALGALVTCTYRGGERETAGIDRTEPAAVVVEPVEPPPNPATEVNEYAYPDRPSFNIVEALFDEFRHYAFWEDDRTEIALWNTRTLSFNDCFEVLRTDQGLYFRPIPELTRLPLEGYGPENSPILFTESAGQWVARYHKARGTTPPRVPGPGRVNLPKLPPPPPPR